MPKRLVVAAEAVAVVMEEDFTVEVVMEEVVMEEVVMEEVVAGSAVVP